MSWICKSDGAGGLGCVDQLKEFSMTALFFELNTRTLDKSYRNSRWQRDPVDEDSIEPFAQRIHDL